MRRSSDGKKDRTAEVVSGSQTLRNHRRLHSSQWSSGGVLEAVIGAAGEGAEDEGGEGVWQARKERERERVDLGTYCCGSQARRGDALLGNGLAFW